MRMGLTLTVARWLPREQGEELEWPLGPRIWSVPSVLPSTWPAAVPQG